MRIATAAWIVAAALVGSGAGSPPAAAQAAASWKPDKPIEIVVNTAPGNSPDRTARAIQRLLQELGLAGAATVSNRVGGGGAVAFGYLGQRPADGHTVAIASKALLTNHLMGRGPDPAGFTWIAHLFGEYVAIVVKADSQIRSGRDLMERLKQDPGAASFGIATSLGNVNHQSLAMPLKLAGTDIRRTRNVVFQAAPLAMTAMLGGHVDVVPMGLGTAVGPMQNGQIRVIVVTAPRRMPGVYAQVPTWKEQGYDVVTSNWRSVIAPKGLPAAQAAWWEQALVKVVETPEWKKDIEANFWDGEFIGSAGVRKLMETDFGLVKSVLTDLELVK